MPEGSGPRRTSDHNIEEVTDVDPLPPTSSSTSTSPHPDSQTTAAPTATSAPPLSPADELLVESLIRRGLLTGEQVRKAQQYGMEHGRDLRQSIL